MTVQERAKVIVVGVTDEVSMGNVGLLNLNVRWAPFLFTGRSHFGRTQAYRRALGWT